MPEIGYWKYIRFNDDEPQYFGADDDVTVVFDSADDRLEYRMKKDIRFEDDAGKEILTIQKATRTLSGFRMTGDLEIEKSAPKIELDSVDGASIGIRFRNAGVFTANFGFDFANDRWFFYDPVAPANRVLIERSTGLMKTADIDMQGNLLKNAKLGTGLKTNGYDIYDGISGNTGSLHVSAGSDNTFNTGACIAMYGIGHASLPGDIYVDAGRALGAILILRTFDSALTAIKSRIIINQGDMPDIDIKNAKLDFHDQTPVAGKVALDEYVEIKVGGITKFLRLYS